MTEIDYAAPAAGLPAPRVAGVAGGVGTTLVARMLDTAADYGQHRPGEAVEVLVCRSVPGQVATAIASATSLDVRPVLVIVDDCPQRDWLRTVTQRVEMARPNLPAVLRVRWIEQLRAVDNPHEALDTGLHAHQYREDIPRWCEPAFQDAAPLIAAVHTLLTTTPAVTA